MPRCFQTARKNGPSLVASPSPRKTGQRPSVFAVPGRSTEGKGGAKARPDSGIRRRMGLAGRKHGKGDGRVASFDGVDSDRDTDEDPMAIGATRTPFPFPPSGSYTAGRDRPGENRSRYRSTPSRDPSYRSIRPENPKEILRGSGGVPGPIEGSVV
eukprot:scaffold2851_cov415-Pavlova_lutheri.AAC.1